ncbi:MAG: outer membrane protein assembly factor BamC, partial [Spongiibacteraceae bacterium]|nr:outer membrane protein assembly factor BamC [Spongiibacteraceae bacterium]
ALLSGCGWLLGDDGIFRDRANDYRKAVQYESLQLPEGFDSSAINSEMAIPEAGAGAGELSGRFEVPRPDPISASVSAGLVRLQRLGDERWVVVGMAPAEVWPRIRQFLDTNQLTTGHLDAQTGVIETSWLQPENAAQERYQFRIEQGIQRNSAEVYVRQQSGQGPWPSRSSDPAREAEMMEALAQFIADQGAMGTVSMLAQRTLESSGRVVLERRSGVPPALRLRLPFARSWASLDAALPRAGFVVEDRNADSRTIVARFAPEDDTTEIEERGWFSSLWQRVRGSGDGERGDRYLIRMEEINREQVRITLDGAEGAAVPTAAVEALLLRIQANLS